MASNTKLYERLRALENASRVELVEDWHRVFKSAPPRYAGPKFMAQGIAYALQERAFGGLSQAIKRQLSSIADRFSLPPVQRDSAMPFSWNNATPGSLSTYECMRQKIEGDMCLQAQTQRTFPDQPASNSGAAVGCIIGTLLGGMVAAALPAIPAVEAMMTSPQALVAGCLGGTVVGAVVGFVRDRLSPSR